MDSRPKRQKGLECSEKLKKIVRNLSEDTSDSDVESSASSGWESDSEGEGNASSIDSETDLHENGSLLGNDSFSEKKHLSVDCDNVESISHDDKGKESVDDNANCVYVDNVDRNEFWLNMGSETLKKMVQSSFEKDVQNDVENNIQLEESASSVQKNEHVVKKVGNSVKAVGTKSLTGEKSFFVTEDLSKETNSIDDNSKLEMDSEKMSDQFTIFMKTQITKPIESDVSVIDEHCDPGLAAERPVKNMMHLAGPHIVQHKQCPLKEKKQSLIKHNESVSLEGDRLLECNSNEEEVKKKRITLLKTARKDKKCLLCNLTFSRYSRCVNHLKRVHSQYFDKTHVCDRCGEKFAALRFLREHVSLKHTRNQKCTFCSYRCHYKRAMQVHIDHVHKRIKQHVCDICGKGYDCSQSALRHYWSAHAKPEEAEICKCEKCDKQFLHPVLLKFHMKKVHLKENKYKCAYCEKGFTQRYMLRDHEFTHTKKRTLKCKICGDMFGTSRSLLYHTKTHNDPEGLPYRCSVCGHGLKSIHGLNMHSYKHKDSSEWPFQCDTCGKSFVSKFNLTKHLRTHTGEKPYQCTYCGKPFANPSNWKTHEKMHLKLGDSKPEKIPEYIEPVKAAKEPRDIKQKKQHTLHAHPSQEEGKQSGKTNKELRKNSATFAKKGKVNRKASEASVQAVNNFTKMKNGDGNNSVNDSDFELKSMSTPHNKTDIPTPLKYLSSKENVNMDDKSGTDYNIFPNTSSGGLSLKDTTVTLNSNKVKNTSMSITKNQGEDFGIKPCYVSLTNYVDELLKHLQIDGFNENPMENPELSIDDDLEFNRPLNIGLEEINPSTDPNIYFEKDNSESDSVLGKQRNPVLHSISSLRNRKISTKLSTNTRVCGPEEATMCIQPQYKGFSKRSKQQGRDVQGVPDAYSTRSTRAAKKDGPELMEGLGETSIKQRPKRLASSKWLENLVSIVKSEEDADEHTISKDLASQIFDQDENNLHSNSSNDESVVKGNTPKVDIGVQEKNSVLDSVIDQERLKVEMDIQESDGHLSVVMRASENSTSEYPSNLHLCQIERKRQGCESEVQAAYNQKVTTGLDDFLKHPELKSKNADGLKKMRQKLLNAAKKDKKCLLCSKVFTNSAERHLKRVHSEYFDQPHACGECGEKFVTSSFLREHVLVKHARKQECSYCSYRCHYKKAMQHHIDKVHKHIKPYSCAICGNGYLTEQLLLHHYWSTHGTPEEAKEICSCEKCDKKFLHPVLLRQHMRRCHPKTMKYKCRYCDKTFRQRNRIHDHEYTHTRNKTLKCKMCGGMFGTTKKLALHIKSHRDPEGFPFRCSVCGHGLKTMRGLVIHSYKHKDNNALPFQCDTCGKSFVTKFNLTKHVRTHTGEKPYQCTYCGKPFANPSNWKTHEKMHLKLGHSKPEKIPEYFEPEKQKQAPKKIKTTKASKRKQSNPLKGK